MTTALTPAPRRRPPRAGTGPAPVPALPPVPLPPVPALAPPDVPPSPVA
ncbi:hypothetical protein NKH77_17310 [Streptomyces sp. M19]